MAGFITYWPKDYIKSLKKAGDTGELSVIFGSQHTKMPSIASVKAGDVIYPVTLAEGTLCVMARLPVEKIEIAFDYLIRETGQIHSALVPEGYALEHEYRSGGVFYMCNSEKYEDRKDLPEGTKILVPKEMEGKPHKFHQEPQTCCANTAASGSHGSKIEARPLPVEILPELQFGPRNKEKPLKLGKDGIPSVVSLSGFVRRMSSETEEIFEKLFSDGKI